MSLTGCITRTVTMAVQVFSVADAIIRPIAFSGMMTCFRSKDLRWNDCKSHRNTPPYGGTPSALADCRRTSTNITGNYLCYCFATQPELWVQSYQIWVSFLLHQMKIHLRRYSKYHYRRGRDHHHLILIHFWI